MANLPVFRDRVTALNAENMNKLNTAITANENNISANRANITENIANIASNDYDIANLSSDKLHRDGSQWMQGELNMSTNQITNVTTPVLYHHAVNKSYVDEQIDNISGGPGSTTFIGLTDTPGAFDNGKIVKSEAAALSFGILESDIFKKDGSVAATGNFLPDSTGIRKLGSTLKHWGDIHSDNHYIHSILYGGFKVGQDLLPNVDETHILGNASYKWDIVWARTVDFNSVCTDLINRMSVGDYINFNDGIEFGGASGQHIINIHDLLPKSTGNGDVGTNALQFANMYAYHTYASIRYGGGGKCDQDWQPEDDNTYDLGNAFRYWKDIYVNGTINFTNPVPDSDKVDACHAGVATGNVFKIPASIAQGDIFYVDVSGHIVRLAAGTNGHFLKTQGAAANLIWAAGVGGVTTWLELTDTPSAFTGQAGKYSKVNAGETALEFGTLPGGGDVVGPASSVNSRIVLFDGSTGKLIKDAGKLLSNTANNIPVLDASADLPLAQIPATLTGKDADSVDGCDAGIATGNVFKIPAGIAQGDIFYVDAAGHIIRLAAGTNGHFLKTQGAAANPIWAAGVGGVTTWLALTDTPGAFDNGKIVKSGAAALSFGILESDIFKKDGSVAATGNFLPDSTGTRQLGSTLKHWGDIHSDNHSIYSTLYGGFKVGQDLLPNADETHILGSAAYKWDIIWARTVDFNSVCTDLINRMSAGDYINFTDGIEFNGAAGRSIINITHLLPKATGASDLGSSTLKFRKVYVGDIIAWDGLSGGIKCEQDWLPFTNNTYDIGSASYYWKNLFLNGYIDLLGLLYVDTIAERTAGVGVTIDTCLIKDGKAADTLKIKGKTVDDAAIGDDKILVYKTAGTKLVYEVKPTGGGQEIVTATLVVAANDSKDKDRADYKCDGTADNVEIQQALDALTAVGGKVVLLEGNYSGILDLDIESKQALVGQGPSTRLSGMDIEIEANASEILIADMYINGNIDLNSHTISNSIFRNLSGLDYILKQTNTNLRSNENILHNVTAKRFAIIGDDNRVSNCFSQSSTSIAFSLTGTRNWLTNCHAFSAYDEAFFLNTATHSILTNITSRDNRYIPIWINSSSHKNVINGGMIIGGNATVEGWTKLIRVQGDDNKISDITIIVKETKTTAAIIVEGTAAKTMLTDLKFIDEGAGSPTEISDSGTNTRLRDNVGFNGAWLTDA